MNNDTPKIYGPDGDDEPSFQHLANEHAVMRDLPHVDYSDPQEQRVISIEPDAADGCPVTLPPVELSEEDKTWLTEQVDWLLDHESVQAMMERIGPSGLIASVHNELGYGMILVPAAGVPAIFGLIQKLLYGPGGPPPTSEPES